MTYLDQLLLEMRHQGLRFMAAGPLRNRLQPDFLEDLRFQQRMNDDVVVVQSARVEGCEDEVSYVFANDQKRFAVQLVPKTVAYRYQGLEYNALRGGDVDGILRFSGQDLHHCPKDCAAIFAQLNADFYHHIGHVNALQEAEPATRSWEPTEPGWETLPLPRLDREGDNSILVSQLLLGEAASATPQPARTYIPSPRAAVGRQVRPVRRCVRASTSLVTADQLNGLTRRAIRPSVLWWVCPAANFER